MSTKEEEAKDNNHNIMMQSVRQVAPNGLLGGMTVSTTDDDDNNSNGAYTKTYHVLFCNTCGDKIDDTKNDHSICTVCNFVTCKSCSVRYNQKNVCLDCFKKDHKLEKFSFMVLKSIQCNINTINKMTLIPNNDIKKIKAELLQEKHITKKFLAPYTITAKGIEILNVYENQIYNSEKDVEEFIGRIISL